MRKAKNKYIFRSDNAPNQEQVNLLGFFVRVFWGLLGNIILLFTAIAICSIPSLFSTYDLMFWILVFFLIVLRYLDIKYLRGCTFDGLPATAKDWRKYVKYFFAISAGIWLLAHGISFIKK